MSKISEIVNLKKRTSDLGYRGFRVDSMIKDEIGAVTLESATDQQTSQVIEALQAYILFARKCQQSKK